VQRLRRQATDPPDFGRRSPCRRPVLQRRWSRQCECTSTLRRSSVQTNCVAGFPGVCASPSLCFGECSTPRLLFSIPSGCSRRALIGVGTIHIGVCERGRWRVRITTCSFYVPASTAGLELVQVVCHLAVEASCSRKLERDRLCRHRNFIRRGPQAIQSSLGASRRPFPICALDFRRRLRRPRAFVRF